MIEQNKAYMLRIDGKLIDCKSVHPYLKYENRGDTEKCIYDLFNWMPQNIEWFYDNSLDREFKELLSIWVKSIHLSDDYKITVSDKLLSKLKLSNNKIIDNKHDIEMYYLHLNNQSNQEFCRVRTSGKTNNQLEQNSIYFRISSSHFNWFNSIWKIVYNNQNKIKTVTICADEYSGKGNFIYKHGKTVVYKLPTADFLTLSGSPVFEHYTKTNTTIYTHTTGLLVEFLDSKLHLLRTKFEEGLYPLHEELFTSVYTNTAMEENIAIRYILDNFYLKLNK